MRTYDLDIQEVENKFVITIDKNQLNADYILNLVNWLQIATIEPSNQNNSFNDFQKIPTEKHSISDQKQRVWKYSGSIDLNNQLENINLRDFAYE